MNNVFKTFELHSGGAFGADTEFGNQAKFYGFTDQQIHHYWYGKPNPSSKLSDQITTDEYFLGVEKVKLANKTLKRQPGKYLDLLARNYIQVLRSKRIFAIGKLNEKMNEVSGGTGWAVQMAINDNKTIFLFDQNQNKWFIYFKGFKEFVEFPDHSKLILDENSAGIGTRDLNDYGLEAIKFLFANTYRYLTEKSSNQI